MGKENLQFKDKQNNLKNVENYSQYEKWTEKYNPPIVRFKKTTIKDFESEARKT